MNDVEKVILRYMIQVIKNAAKKTLKFLDAPACSEKNLTPKNAVARYRTTRVGIMLMSWICTHFEKMCSFVEMFMLLNLAHDNQDANACDTPCHSKKCELFLLSENEQPS